MLNGKEYLEYNYIGPLELYGLAQSIWKDYNSDYNIHGEHLIIHFGCCAENCNPLGTVIAEISYA